MTRIAALVAAEASSDAGVAEALLDRAAGREPFRQADHPPAMQVGQLGFELQDWGRSADGREEIGRTIDVPDFGFGLEIVGDELHADPLGEHVVTVDVEGQLVALRGPEDIIIAYAESGWDTHHAREWERALAVFRAMRESLDMDRLRRRAAERRMPAVLDEVLHQRPLPSERRPLR